MTNADTTAAFLAKIIAHPADDGPRLVMADWCEEHGQGERAELIRVQVEIAKITSELKSDEDCEAGFCVSCDDRRKLNRRAAELLAEHEAEWVRDELGLALGIKIYQSETNNFYHSDDLKFHWHRGFVSQVECTLETWRGRTCERCEEVTYQNGIKARLVYEFAGPDSGWVECPDCHGVGRVGSIGPLLVRRAPIEAVVVTDKKPLGIKLSSGGTEFAFYDPTQARFGVHRESDLPTDLFNEIDGYLERTGRKRFPSAAAANAALSTALLQEARETPLTDVKEKVYS